MSADERGTGMIRKLRRLGDSWVLPLRSEELVALGLNTADEGETPAVLVKMKPGGRLEICRAPTFVEAMQGTMDQHKQALERLAELE